MKLLESSKDSGKRIVELSGVMPNPTVEKLYEGCKLARENHVDLILAVGGGSVCDYAKALSVSAYCDEDPWDKYYLRMEDADERNYSGGLYSDNGGHRFGDEWRRSNYKS